MSPKGIIPPKAVKPTEDTGKASSVSSHPVDEHKGAKADPHEKKGETADHGAPATKNPPTKAAIVKSLVVIQLSDGTSGKAKKTQKELATLSSVKDDLHLEDLRKLSKGKITKDQAFCDKEQAIVLESTTLKEYLSSTSGTSSHSANKIKVTDEHTLHGENSTIYVVKLEQDHGADSRDKTRGTNEKGAPDAAATQATDNNANSNVGSGGGIGQAGDGALQVDKQDQGMLAGAKHASQLSSAEWEIVLDNCGAMYGWIIDRRNNRVEQAPMPAFRLRRLKTKVVAAPSRDTQDPKSGTDSEDPNDGTPDKSTANEDEERIPSSKGASTSNGTQDQPGDDDDEEAGTIQATSVDSGASNDIAIAKPRYHVSDNSRIEISSVSHQLASSMAANDFGSQSTEASVSGGVGAFAASVSGDYATSHSSSQTEEEEKKTSTMIGKYMIPRATIQLEPGDLEPSQDLLDALDRLKKTRSVVDMRKIYSNFGQLFCKKIVVGGRLMTSKQMDSSDTKSASAQKEDFKASISASVSTPWVDASVSHQAAGGGEQIKVATKTDTSEHHAFDAVGGDTLLSSNPVAWVSSCSLAINWRVIDRVALTPLVDAISEMPGYRSVKSLYAQAVPVLSRYIAMPDSREILVRLCLASPTNGLSLSYQWEGNGAEKDTARSYYLGHSPSSAVKPLHFFIKDPQNAFWGECIPGTDDNILFAPESYRAPAVYGYAGDLVKDSYFGRTLDEEYVSTVWSLTTPFDTALSHGCRVVLRTTVLPPSANSKNRTPCPASLVVFRNQQGVFLPAMSDDGQGHIFRVLKRGAKQQGETIKEGDQIRLCWTFADQTIGFRDFTQDVFGRRRNTWPASLQQSVLYMKLPWPRFESLAKPEDKNSPIPNALMMSDVATEDPMITAIGTRTAARKGGPMATSPCGVQDVSFRIDLVPNDGQGDVTDYMLAGLHEGPKDDKPPAPVLPTISYHTKELWFNGVKFMFLEKDP